MPLASYNPGNPAGMDPWSIESTLAPLAVSGNPAAQNMLADYRAQREAANDVYGQNLGQEHQFAYKQLAQQLQEANVKEFANIAKLPGGAEFAAQMPSMVGAIGAEPGAWTNLARAGTLANTATNLKDAGTGVNQLSQGGYPVDPTAVTSITGVPVGAYRGPAIVQGDIIKANAQLMGDRIKANATLGPSDTVKVTDAATQAEHSLNYPRKMTRDQINADLASRGLGPVDAPAGSPPLPGGAAQGSSGGKSTYVPPQNEKAGNAALQQQVQANLGKMPPAVQQQIRGAAAKNGGQPVVGVDQQGPYALGADGNKYR